MSSLSSILAARDARHQKQVELLRSHPDETLLCLTVIMPGAEKRNALSLAVANAAVGALRSVYPDYTYFEERDLDTGFEAFMLVPLSELEAKRLAVELEDSHPLGRLFDVDVIQRILSSEGDVEDVVPISRSAIGSSPRRCLICDNEARFCMRQHAHTQEELMARIQEMVAQFPSLINT